MVSALQEEQAAMSLEAITADHALGSTGDSYLLRIREINMPPLKGGGHTFHAVSEFCFLSPQSEQEPAAIHAISFLQIASNSTAGLQINAWLARDNWL